MVNQEETAKVLNLSNVALINSSFAKEINEFAVTLVFGEEKKEFVSSDLKLVEKMEDFEAIIKLS